MRCEEVTRELAVPTPARDDLAIAQHLAGCEACARWAEQAAEFDRLWDATRPAEPSGESWDELWASVTARLDASPCPAVNGGRSTRVPNLLQVPPASAGRGRVWRGLAAVGIVGLAQAAALLIAVGVAWHGTDKPTPLPREGDSTVVVQNSTVGLDSVIDVEEGEVPLIRPDGKRVRVDGLAAQDAPNGVDEWYLFWNVLEPMAKSVMAMAE